MNNSQNLLLEITKMQPVEFAGLAKLLGVNIVQKKEGVEYTSTAPESPADIKKNYEARPFADVLGDVMAKYDKLNRQRKREILRLVKKSNSNHKGGDGLNASNT